MNERQTKFVDEYLIDLNATAAAKRAGYSERTAYSQAERLLRNDEVRRAIMDGKQKRSERTKIDADWLLTRLSAEAHADIRDLYDDAGDIRPIHEWPLIWRQGLVAGIDTTKDKDGNITRKIRLANRDKRLELIGRHIDVQAFKDRVEVNMSVDRAAELERFLGKKIDAA